MDYNTKASEIESSLSELESVINSLKNTTISSVWTGDVAMSQQNQLEEYITKLEQEKENIQSYASSLYKLQKYKDNNERIITIQKNISELSDSTDNTDVINSLTTEIGRINRENNALKTDIKWNINKAKTIVSTNHKINYTVESTNLPLDTAD